MTTYKVQKRNMDSKARKLRREGYVTGSVYGKNMETILIQIPQKEAERIQRECLKGSQLNLELDGKTYDVLLKEIEYNALKREILELDFQALSKNEKVHCTTEVVLCNKEMVQEGVVQLLLSEISYKAYPDAILNRIDVDCSRLRVGDELKVSDLSIAQDKDIEIQTHLDTPVVRVLMSRNEQEETDSEEEA